MDYGLFLLYLFLLLNLTAMSKINILHICNNYWCNSLYKQLITHLSNDLGINQFVFVPTRSSSDQQNNIIGNKNITVIYSYIVKNLLIRLLFPFKIYLTYKALIKSVNINSINLTHSHTIFSDGIISYFLKKNHNINYIVAVRNTDINFFIKYIPFMNFFGKKVLLNAKNIIFISPSYKSKILSIYPEISDIISNKSKVITNGINEFWINNSNFKLPLKDDIQVFKFIYVGEIGPNKNLHSLVKSIQYLNDSNGIVAYKLSIIGKGKKDNFKYLSSIEKLISEDSYINIYSSVNKDELLLLFREYDALIMVSFNETFGLVFPEALSQGLPIVYSENQGIDGVFNNGFVGFRCDPHVVKSISNSMANVKTNYNSLILNTTKTTSKFNWVNISEDYKNIYYSILNSF